MTDEKKPEDTNNGEAPTEEAPAESAEPDSVEAAAASELAEALDERTRDLQRVTAEYHNYRKRVDRDRQAAADQATANVMTSLLPVLDDIDRARDHGDLVGPFGSVAEQLLNTLNKLGLETFGDKGDAFDPMVHEAVAHMHSDDVTEPTCIDVMRRGYRLGDRLVRAAMVAVAEPSEEVAVPAADSEPAGDDSTEKASAEDEQSSAGPSLDDEPTDEGSTEEASSDETDGEQPVDATESTGEKSTGATTENLDADVPDDEEALKGEVVENAVAEASDAEEAASEEDDSDEASEETATDEGGDAKSDGTTDDGSGDKK